VALTGSSVGACRAAWILALATFSAIPPAAAVEGGLLEAVRRGEEGRVRTLLRSGAGVDVSTPSGWTPLMEAAQRGSMRLADLLLAAGADPDARDRIHGTALDVAERAGHAELARLLREGGARGSGKSVGDVVCVRHWGGSGFCGRLEAVEPTRYRIHLLRVEGCGQGCPADSECSEGRTVGGAGGLAPEDTLWVRSWCVTHTGLR
jgi:ankyrin repeat protein